MRPYATLNANIRAEEAWQYLAVLTKQEAIAIKLLIIDNSLTDLLLLTLFYDSIHKIRKAV